MLSLFQHFTTAKNCTMTTRKPSWGWKAKGCSEIWDVFDCPFAAKEYVQNQVGQVLKETQSREWSDWKISDLQNHGATWMLDIEKRGLASKYPGLMTGPHGATLQNNSTWRPSYIVTATVPRARLTSTTYDTDLKICTVFWKHRTTGLVTRNKPTYSL